MNVVGSSGNKVVAHRWSRRFGVVASVVSLAAALTVSPVGASTPSRSAAVAPMASAAQMVSFDQQMILLVNQARAAAKVPALTEARGLTLLATWWSSQESGGVNNYTLAHNPNAWTMLTVSPYGASNRTTWGENVAWSSSTASTAQQIFTAYMNSPGHRANILSKNYHYIGMGTVGGDHGLFNTTEFTDAVQAGQAVTPPVVKPTPPVVKPAPPVVKPAPPVVKPKPPVRPTPPVVRPTPIRKFADGTFIRDISNSAVYRVAGGAPLYISSWRSVGGVKPAISVSHAQIAAMPKVPANGTFIRTSGNNSVYRIAGGAPIFVVSWAPFGGKARPTVAVDPAVVANSGQGGHWANLKKYPVTTTFIQASGSAKVYKVVNGTPTHITSWAGLGGRKPTVPVDPRAIARAGGPAQYSHLKR